MPNKLLLAAAERSGFKRFITTHDFTRKVTDRFVAGESTNDGIAAARELETRGVSAILDLLGENVTNEHQADAAAAAYISILDEAARERQRCHISVKLTQLGLNVGIEETLRRMEKICAKAAEVGTVVAIDMESHEYTDGTIDTYRKLRTSHDNLVLCLQAYLKRTLQDVESLIHLKPAIRLCKGAYNEPDEMTHDRSATRRAYKTIVARLLQECPYTAVATHDDELIEFTEGYARALEIPKDRFEFQMLYGIRRDAQAELASSGYAVRVYIPFGDEWYPYLMRRLAERPSNLRFFLEAVLRG